MTTITSAALNESARPTGTAETARQIAPDLFTALLGATGPAPASAEDRAIGVGRQGAPAALGKRNRKPGQAPSDIGATSNPTTIAVAALASRGTPKATVQAAEADKTSPRSGPVPGSEGANRKERQGSAPAHRAESPSDSASKDHAPTRPDRAPPQTDPVPPPPTAKPGHPTPHGGATPPRSGFAVGPAASTSNPAALLRLLHAGGPRPADRAQGANPRAFVRSAVALQAQGSGEGKAASKAPVPSRFAQAQHPEGEFAAQLGRGFAAVMRQNGGSLTLRLQPEELGDMTIRMELSPGRVTATFEVDSDQARQLLDANMSALRSALEARGLGVDALTVRVSEDGERPTLEATGQERAEPDGSAGGAGNGRGGASGEGGSGTDRPTADGATLFASARSAELTLPDAGAAAGVDEGGARMICLVLDAVA